MKRGEEARFFTQPSNPKQRLYEALRAVFVEERPFQEAAESFGYGGNTLHVQASPTLAPEKVLDISRRT